MNNAHTAEECYFVLHSIFIFKKNKNTSVGKHSIFKFAIYMYNDTPPVKQLVNKCKSKCIWLSTIVNGMHLAGFIVISECRAFSMYVLKC